MGADTSKLKSNLLLASVVQGGGKSLISKFSKLYQTSIYIEFSNKILSMTGTVLVRPTDAATRHN